MMRIERGIKRTSKPDIFISHSSKDNKQALQLAKDLNFCSVDVWLDQWELQIGMSLTDEISKAMDDSRYIAVLITENYNKSVWTKTEYKKALSREQKEERNVLLPIIVGEAVIPDFIEDKIYIDLRSDYFSGLTKISGMIHELSEFRISEALNDNPPKDIKDIWQIFESIGFEPYVIFGKDDFDEILKYGGELIREDYAYFYPKEILKNANVSEHTKKLLFLLFNEH
jgi:hypothetical protein